MRVRNILLPFILLTTLAAAGSAGAISLAPSGISQYIPATITNQEIRKELEKRLKEHLDAELNKVSSGALGEADVTTYLQIIDHCANGEADKARNLAGEQVAGMLLKAVLGSGAGAITWAWDFAKGSYTEVQRWAEDQSRQYFIKNFLLPRVNQWRQGNGNFANIGQLARQFNEWFEFPENQKAITATKPWLDRKKWVDRLKDEMWAKTLDLALKYRKYHDQVKKLQARARDKKRSYYYFATRQYQQLLKKSAADKLSVTQSLRTSLSGAAPGRPNKKAPAVQGKHDGPAEPQQNDTGTRQPGQLPTVRPGCVNIDPAQQTRRLQGLLYRRLLDKLENYQKTNIAQLANFREANIGIYNGTIDWSYYTTLARPFLAVPPEPPRIPYKGYVYDPVCLDTVVIFYNDAIKSVFRKQQALYKSWHEEVLPAYESAAGRRNQAIAKLKKFQDQLRNTALEIKKDALPDFNDLNPQENFYAGQNDLAIPENPDQRIIDNYSMALFGYVYLNYEAGIQANNGGALNNAAAAISEVENELDRVVQYAAEKKSQWERNIQRASRDVDVILNTAEELINETMNLAGAGSNEVTAVMDSMARLQRALTENQLLLDQYRTSLTRLESDIQHHARKFAAFNDEINLRFLNNRIYDKASEEARLLLPELDRYWHIYQLKNSFEYTLDQRNINISFTMKSLRELIDAWQGGGLLQPVMVDRMVKIARQDWYKKLVALNKGEVAKFISAFQKGEKFLDQYTGLRVLPVDNYNPIPVLFPEVKNKAVAYLLPFSRKYADFHPGMGPLKNYRPNLYEEFAKFKKQMDEIQGQWPTMFGLSPNRPRETSGPQPAGQTEKAQYITREMIEALYGEFAREYSNRNLTGVLRLLADDWSSADGSDLTDLEESLANSFDAFDRIEYRISNLENGPLHHTTEVSISYTAKVTGYILDQDLTHEESFAVNEMVAIENGSLKIKKTLGNVFW
ncbi:MAG: hypothetical protein L3J03_00900 [Desulfobacterales bacterium]|nr:hypothetical protein [Desulfobacterales bacterium]